MQDVTAALQRAGLGFNCYLDPSRPALIDADHSVRVNYETYIFADTATRDAFRADVVRYCGLLTDPVSKGRFRPDTDSPQAEYADVLYYFEEQSHKDMFLMDPEGYRLPGYTM